jgi:hypothetical protein
MYKTMKLKSYIVKTKSSRRLIVSATSPDGAEMQVNKAGETVAKIAPVGTLLK